MALVVIIGDDPQMLEMIRDAFTSDGYETAIAKAIPYVVAKIRRGKADAVIVDLTNRRNEAYRLLRQIRDIDLDVALLMLNGGNTEGEKIRALQMGADDYLTALVGTRELIARTESILRRRARLASSPNVIHSVKPVVRRFGTVDVNVSSLQVWRSGAPVSLRPKEMDLLLALMEREGRVVSREELLQRVWGYEREVSSRTVDNHIAKLRRKLEQRPSAPNHIISVRKKGYRFQT